METSAKEIAELMQIFYDQYLEMYGDEDLASLAAAESINKVLAGRLNGQADEHSN